MWRRAVFVLLAGCGRIDFDPQPGEGAPVVAASDLVAWWGMQSLDPAGDHFVVIDLTGRGHDATCTMSCPRVGPGRWGNGFVFDGAQLMQAPSAADLELTTGFTIALWIAVAGTPAPRYQPVTKSLGDQVFDSWAISVESDLSISAFADGSVQHGVAGTRMIGIGEWHHVAFRWDGSVADVVLDGTVDGSGTIADIGWDDDPVNLGADYESGAPITFLSGAIDDVRIYRRALTDAELADLAR